MLQCLSFDRSGQACYSVSGFVSFSPLGRRCFRASLAVIWLPCFGVARVSACLALSTCTARVEKAEEIAQCCVPFASARHVPLSPASLSSQYPRRSRPSQTLRAFRSLHFTDTLCFALPSLFLCLCQQPLNASVRISEGKARPAPLTPKPSDTLVAPRVVHTLPQSVESQQTKELRAEIPLFSYPTVSTALTLEAVLPL